MGTENCRNLVYAGICVVFAAACWGPSPEPRIETFEGPRIGTSVTRDRPARGVHETIWFLSEPGYLQGMVDQKSVDLRLRWMGPGQRVLRELDGGGTKVEENFALRAETPGEYRLEVTAAEAVEEDLGGPYTLELFELREAKPGDEARLQGWDRFQQGRHAYQHGRPEQAQLLFEETLREFERVGDPLGEAMTLQQLGWLADHQRGDVRSARSLYRRARERFTKTSAKLLEFDLVSDLAAAERTLGDSDASLTLYQEARAFFEAAGLEQRLAKTLTGLGLVLLDSGKAEEARPVLETALSMHREFLGESSWEVATQNGLGLVESAVGSLTSALQRYEEALRLARSSGDRLGTIHSLIHMSACYRRLGELEEALRLLEEADDETPRTETTEREIEAALFETWLSIGDLERAQDHAQRVLTLSLDPDSSGAVENPRNLAEAHFYLASTHWLLEDFESSCTHFEEAEKLLEGRKIVDVERVVQLGRARCLSHRGELPAASALLEKVRWQGPSGGRFQIFAQAELGDLYRQQARYEESWVLIDDALRQARELALTSLEASILGSLAQLKWAQQDFAEAYSAIEESLELQERLRSRVGHDHLRALFLARRLEHYRFAVDLLLEMHRRKPQAGYAEQALAAHERTRARTLLELLGARVDPDRKLPRELREQQRAALSRLTSVQRRLMGQFKESDPDPATVEHLRTELQQVLRDVDRLDLEAQNRPSELAFRPLDLPAVQDLLAPDTALLEYVLGEERSYVFVVTNSDLTLLELPEEAMVKNSVRNLQRLLQHRERRTTRVGLAAFELHKLVLKPVESRIRGKRHLVIVPDGDLFYVPFEVLRASPPTASTASPDEYVLGSWSVTYAPSAMSLVALADREEPPQDRLELLAFSFSPNDDSGDARDGDTTTTSTTRALTSGQVPRLGRLPHARDEVAHIAELFPAGSARVYHDEDATEAEVKASADLARARRIHFAAHGLINETRPELSAVYLAEGERGVEDGLLQAHEIFRLKISADLVVLSACQTGLGKQVRGEGLLGLSRAFFSAGTPLLMVSLWSVDDASTSLLMQEFYRLQRDGIQAREALRRAKLSLLERPTLNHPYYWAPFVLVGKD